jgi:uncharacterized protein YecT (DUF1311 family)
MEASQGSKEIQLTPSEPTLQEAERMLNKNYQRLRSVLTKTEKEALKIEELEWLNDRKKHSQNSREYLNMTLERAQELNHRFTHGS